MDRPVTYFGQVPRSLDVLNVGQDAMVALAKLSEALLGTAVAIAGFACTATTPASLNLVVGPGQIYEIENLEATTVSGLQVDTHQILKQGINLDPTALTLVPPTTVGFAVNILIEAQYADADTGQVLLTFQNPSVSGQTFQGPGGNGQQSNTVRKGVATLQPKYGTPATSGQQTTPTPDAGFVGIAVVTLAYGQTAFTSTNIVTYFAAPYFANLPSIPPGVQSGKWLYGVDTGAADAAVVPLNPTPAALTPGMEVLAKIIAPNATTTPRITLAGFGPLPIVRQGGQAPQAGDVGNYTPFIFDGANLRLNGLVPSDIRAIVGTLTRVLLTANLTIYVRTDGNDANNGLANTAAGAFKTIAVAYAYLCQTYIFAGFTVTIQLGIAGTYAGSDFPNLGVTGTVILRGDPTSNITAQNYIVSALVDPYASRCITSSIQTVTTTGVMLDMSGATNGFAAWAHAGGGLYLGNSTVLKFSGNAPNISLIGVDNGSTLNTFGSVQVLGGGTFGNVFYILGAFNGSLGVTQPTTFIINSVAFTTFCSASDGSAQFQYYTFSQSGNTGSKYYANLNGIINSYGLTLPGSTVGTIATGGQYV